MSSDEFDPDIERLFARTPVFNDAATFNAAVQARLDRGVRFRTMALSLAGLVGGVIAVRESLRFDIGVTDGQGVRSLTSGLQLAGSNAQETLRDGLTQLGLSDLGVGSMGAMSLFWMATAALIAVAAVGAMKLSQEI